MREFIIIFIILILIGSGALYTSNYLNKTSKGLVSKLEDLKKNVNEHPEDIENLKNEVNNVYNEWEKVEDGWAIIVLHSELDLIETAFVRMKAQIEKEEINKSVEEINTGIFLVNHISEKEKFSLKNIF